MSPNLFVYSDMPVKVFYVISNWVFIEIISTGQTGFIPIYCLDLSESSCSSSTGNNLSLFNVSIHEKSIGHGQTSGDFLSSIGPCRLHAEQTIVTNPRTTRTNTYTRQLRDQSNLSRQISNMSLHAYDHDAYGTLNITPCKSASLSVLDNDVTVSPVRSRSRLRVLKTYQRQYVGDISVLESEVVSHVELIPSTSDWRLVRRGDGRQGFIPKMFVVHDQQTYAKE
jgi:hypothetical protein